MSNAGLCRTCVASVFISEFAVILFGIIRAADVSKPYATWAGISVQCVRALVRFVDRQTRIRFLKAHHSRACDCSKIFRNLLDLFMRFILNQTTRRVTVAPELSAPGPCRRS